ncbi:MAG: biotin transporter BioY [Acidimicrobiia bacterium]|nr:biotin transporter BioY [Acidimicrobiia bacterium]
MSTAALAPRTLADLLPAPTVASQRITRDAALIGGFAALTAVLAQVKFSLGFTPVPITGQTLATLLAGTVLGWKRGAASQFVYWVAGIFMPFAWYANDETGSSISAGWNYAIGTTAGYMVGFVLAAALVGALAERGQDRDLMTSVPAMLAGTAVIYTCGVGWLAIKLDIPVATGETNAIGLGLVPFLIGDAIKLIIAGAAAPAVWRILKRS